VPHDAPAVLDYQRGLESRPRPRPMGAFLFCLPSILLWSLPMAARLGRHLWNWPLPGKLPVIALFVAAVASGIGSLIYYSRRQHPWYVSLCLLINILSLMMCAFIALLLGGFLYVQR
jgi:hypothetical protein